MIAQSQRLAPFRSALTTACQNHDGKRLISLALFGSWARTAATPVPILTFSSSLNLSPTAVWPASANSSPSKTPP